VGKAGVKGKTDHTSGRVGKSCVGAIDEDNIVIGKVGREVVEMRICEERRHRDVFFGGRKRRLATHRPGSHKSADSFESVVIGTPQEVAPKLL
jgi:hypothetical protein